MTYTYNVPLQYALLVLYVWLLVYWIIGIQRSQETDAIEQISRANVGPRSQFSCCPQSGVFHLFCAQGSKFMTHLLFAEWQKDWLPSLQENEYVVRNALLKYASSFELVHIMPSWPSRGLTVFTKGNWDEHESASHWHAPSTWCNRHFLYP